MDLPVAIDPGMDLGGPRRQGHSQHHQHAEDDPTTLATFGSTRSSLSREPLGHWVRARLRGIGINAVRSAPNDIPLRAFFWCAAAAHLAGPDNQRGRMVKRCNGLGMSSSSLMRSRFMLPIQQVPTPAFQPASSIFCTARAPSISCQLLAGSVTTATAQLACSMNRPLVHRAPSCFNMFLSWIIEMPGLQLRALG